MRSSTVDGKEHQPSLGIHFHQRKIHFHQWKEVLVEEDMTTAEGDGKSLHHHDVISSYVHQDQQSPKHTLLLPLSLCTQISALSQSFDPKYTQFTNIMKKPISRHSPISL